MLIRISARIIAVASFIAAQALGQAPVNDDCANATPVTVNVPIAGTLMGATQDGFAACEAGGSSLRDVWFAYTNTTPGSQSISGAFCSDSGPIGIVDPVLSFHETCGGVELTCSDQCTAMPCASSSTCTFRVVVSPGQTVRIRVSDNGLGGSGEFSLIVKEGVLPLAPGSANCFFPLTLYGPGTYAFDTTFSSPTSNGTVPGCTTVDAKSRWFRYQLQRTGTLTVSTCGLMHPASPQNTRIALYFLSHALANCPSLGSGMGCNDDAGAACASGSQMSTVSVPVVCGQWIAIQVGSANATTSVFGSFSVVETGTPCATQPRVICVGATDTCSCGNIGAQNHGCANSAYPGGAVLETAGTASLSADSLDLILRDTTGPCLFAQSTSWMYPHPWGDGSLCFYGGVTRLGVAFPTAGVATWSGATVSSPLHSAGAPVFVGQQKYYQAWYRDSAPYCIPDTYNFSNGLLITWIP